MLPALMLPAWAVRLALMAARGPEQRDIAAIGHF
jgi:hypothetical protein